MLGWFGWGAPSNEVTAANAQTKAKLGITDSEDDGGDTSDGRDDKVAAMALNVDARNVEFYDDHHRFSRGNYGITRWLDVLLGTVARRYRGARLRRTADDNDSGS